MFVGFFKIYFRNSVEEFLSFSGIFRSCSERLSLDESKTLLDDTKMFCFWLALILKAERRMLSELCLAAWITHLVI